MATAKKTTKKKTKASSKKKAPAKKAAAKKTGKKAPKKKAPDKAKVAITAKNPGVRKWLEDVNAERAFKGKTEIRTADKVRTPYALRRATGILGVDCLGLGGGFPAGGQVEIHGPESSGKTFLTYHTCGELQRVLKELAAIAIFSTELRPDKAFMRLANFCVAYSEEEIVEMAAIRHSYKLPDFTADELDDLRMQIGDIVIITAATADVGFDVVERGLQAGIFQLMVIDSFGALLTVEVDKGKVGDAHYAGPSRIVTQLQNKIFPLFNMDRPDGSMLETTLIGINQMRSNIGASRFEDSEKPGMGAWSWKHGQLINLKLEKGAKIWEGEKGKSPVVGHTVRWLTTKGKAGTHDGKKGTYEYYHFPKHTPVFWKDVQEYCEGGPGIFEDVVETAKTLGVIDVAGSWLSWDGDDGYSNRTQGGDKMALYFAENPEALACVKDQCRLEAGLLVRFK